MRNDSISSLGESISHQFSLDTSKPALAATLPVSEPSPGRSSGQRDDRAWEGGRKICVTVGGETRRSSATIVLQSRPCSARAGFLQDACAGRMCDVPGTVLTGKISSPTAVISSPSLRLASPPVDKQSRAEVRARYDAPDSRAEASIVENDGHEMVEARRPQTLLPPLTNGTGSCDSSVHAGRDASCDEMYEIEQSHHESSHSEKVDQKRASMVSLQSQRSMRAKSIFVPHDPLFACSGSMARTASDSASNSSGDNNTADHYDAAAYGLESNQPPGLPTATSWHGDLPGTSWHGEMPTEHEPVFLHKRSLSVSGDLRSINGSEPGKGRFSVVAKKVRLGMRFTQRSAKRVSTNLAGSFSGHRSFEASKVLQRAAHRVTVSRAFNSQLLASVKTDALGYSAGQDAKTVTVLKELLSSDRPNSELIDLTYDSRKLVSEVKHIIKKEKSERILR